MSYTKHNGPVVINEEEKSRVARVPSSQIDAPIAKEKVTIAAMMLGLMASIGGFMFGYVSGQISGFFLMDDYEERFAEKLDNGSYYFSAAREGSIVGLMSIGCLIGCLISGKLADVIGRRLTISASAFFSCLGVAVEVSSSTSWGQFAVGRLVNGMGIGALSVVVPMYQGESSPAIIRGVLISMYQLFVALGIFVAELVNFGTESIDSSASWRIPNGLSFLWALALGAGILLLPESPRYAFACGREDEARKTIAKLGGLELNSPAVTRQMNQIRAKLEEESGGGDFSFIEIFTGPRMLYRLLLGVALQSGQQLTGANFFFYFGTTVFSATGISNSYITQAILGAVNVICTFGGLLVVAKCGRRVALIVGALWMMMCFIVYAFVGHFALDHDNPTNTPQAGTLLVAFSCLFIAGFATTWGPLVWAVVAELYPARYRSAAMGVATASNWFWNFMMSFFTRFITDAIDYLYGLVFAFCCAGLAMIVFFCLIESKDRSLEEIDTMYIQRVSPMTSKRWDAGSTVVHNRLSRQTTNKSGEPIASTRA